MYASSRQYAEQYRKIGATSSILEADPHKLVQLLLEGASSRLRQAMAHMERGDQAAKGKAIGRTCDIVSHLASTLEPQQGSDIADNLGALYDYILLRLTQGNVGNDRQALEEALSLLVEIETAWSGIASARNAQAALA
jgi:flagellar secretion chaperone FliS